MSAPLMVAMPLEGRHVLIIGGGKVARDRVESLRPTGARITILSPELRPDLQAAAAAGELRWIPQRWAARWLESLAPDMVLAAITDEVASEDIAARCRAARIPVNVADQPARCDFWFASVHRDGPLQIAVSTSGAGPALAGRLRRELAGSLPPVLGEALRRFGALRAAVRAADPAPSASPRRMRWLKAAGQRLPWSALAELDVAAMVQRYRGGRAPAPGRVTLVGAGPGDPRLMTIAAREALASADLVLCDRLVPPAIRALVGGELRIARKRPGRADAAQAELNAWMLAAARAGQRVVRLKCGDPFVFGRGGEEVTLLEDAGVAVEVIPGVSAALAAPLLANIPATCRGVADRVVISTGRGAGGGDVPPPDFREETTAIFLMSVGRLPSLVTGLLAAGWPPDWPAAAIERASHPEQRTLRAPLSALCALAAEEGLAAPAVIVVGQVAREAAAGALRAAV